MNGFDIAEIILMIPMTLCITIVIGIMIIGVVMTLIDEIKHGRGFEVIWFVSVALAIIGLLCGSVGRETRKADERRKANIAPISTVVEVERTE